MKIFHIILILNLANCISTIPNKLKNLEVEKFKCSKPVLPFVLPKIKINLDLYYHYKSDTSSMVFKPGLTPMEEIENELHSSNCFLEYESKFQNYLVDESLFKKSYTLNIMVSQKDTKNIGMFLLSIISLFTIPHYSTGTILYNAELISPDGKLIKKYEYTSEGSSTAWIFLFFLVDDAFEHKIMKLQTRELIKDLINDKLMK